MTALTPIYGIKYLTLGEPARNTRQALEDNAFTVEAALQAGGVAAPGASDLLAVSGRVSVLETAAAARPYAVMRGSGTLSLTSGTWTALPMAAEDADPLGGHSTTTTTSRWTCPAGQGGLYLVGGTAAFTTTSTAGRRYAGIRKGGVETAAQEQYSPSAASGTTLVGAPPSPIPLAAGEYVELYAYQDSGGALNANLSSSQLWVARLFPLP